MSEIYIFCLYLLKEIVDLWNYQIIEEPIQEEEDYIQIIIKCD